jgi:hypothetical protein
MYSGKVCQSKRTPFGERRAGDVLDAFHQRDEVGHRLLPRRRAQRREAHAAVAHHDAWSRRGGCWG